MAAFRVSKGRFHCASWQTMGKLTLRRSCHVDGVIVDHDEGSHDRVKIAVEFSLENILKFIRSVESFLKRGAISFPPRPVPHTWHGGARFAWGSACSQSGPREGRRLACPVEPVIPTPSDETPASGPHRPAGGAQVCRGPALLSGTALGRSEGRQVSDHDL